MTIPGRIKSLIKKLTRIGYQVRSKHPAADPVCGMPATSNLFMSEYQGKKYYFCSDHCQKQFDLNPAGYAS